MKGHTDPVLLSTRKGGTYARQMHFRCLEPCAEASGTQEYTCERRGMKGPGFSDPRAV